MTEHGRTFRIGLLTLIMAFVVVGGIVALSGSAAAFTLEPDNGYNDSLVAGAENQQIGKLVQEDTSKKVQQSAIALPDGITVSDDAVLTTSSTNITSSDVSVSSDRSRINVDYETIDNNNQSFLNITGVRLDVAPDASSATISSFGDTFTLDVSSPTITANSTVNLTRGQNQVGPQNVSITAPNTEVAGQYNKSVIGDGSDVTIAIPDGEDRLSFDTGATVEVFSNQSSPAVQNGTEASVTENAVSFTASNGNLSTSESLNVTGLQYDTTGLTDDSLDATFVSNLTVTTSAETPVSTREETINATVGTSAVNVEAPGASLNKTIQVTSGQSNLTRFNVSVQDNTQSGGAIAADETVTISIPDSVEGIQFNTSDSAPPIEAISNKSYIDDSTGNNAKTSVFANTREIGFTLNNSTTGVTGGPDVINITNVTLDSLAGASNASFNLTVQSTADNADSIVQNTSVGTTVAGGNSIEVANGNTVFGDINGTTNGLEFNTTGTPETINSSGKLRPGDQVTSAINVTTKFGNDSNPNGVTVDLNATSNPSDNTLLSTDSVTTNETGVALFDVTLGEQTGTYNVTASLAHNESANVTLEYNVQPGDPADISVTKANNSVIDDSGLGTDPKDLEIGAYKVNVVDSQGNPTGINSDTSFTLDTSADVVNVTYNNTGSSGTPAKTDTALNNPSGDVYRYNNSVTGDPVEFYVFVASTTPGEPTLTVSAEGSEDTGSITVYDNPSDADVSIRESSPAAGDDINVTATPVTSDGTPIQVAGISSSFSSSDSAIAYVRSSAGPTDTNGESTAVYRVRSSGQASLNATFTDSAFNDVTGSTTLGAEDEPAPGQVELTNVNLDPDTVNNGTTNDHTLTFDATNVSDDGNTDTFTIEFPSVATLNSLDDASVTDADGDTVSIEDSDVSGNTITVDVAPDSSADTRDLTVSADVNVTAPDVTSDATANIDISVTDSNNGQDETSVTLTVNAVAPGDAPADFPGSAEQFTAISGDDGDINTFDLVDAIEGASDDGVYNGVEITTFDFVDIIEYNSEA